ELLLSVCFGELLIAAVFLLLRNIQVIKVAVELVEPVHGWKVFVAVAEVVLPKLTGGVPFILQHFCKAWRRELEPTLVARHSHRGQAGPDRILARDECGTTGGARVLR